MFLPLFSFLLLLSTLITAFFFLPQSSILSLLFILEAATLSSLITLFLIYWSPLFITPFLSFIFITFSACGASLGLAILVANVRFWGTDTLKSLTSTSC